MDIIVGIGVIAAVAALGGLAARAVLPDPPPTAVLGLAFPLGGGLITFGAFLGSWTGIPLTRVTAVTLWIVLSAAAWRLARMQRRPIAGAEEAASGATPGRPRWDLREPRLLPVRLALLVFGALAATAAVTAVGRSHSSYDAAAMWIIKGYGIAREASIFGAQQWGAHGLAYPLNLHLLVMLFRLVSTDQAPASQLIFLLFYVSTVLTVLTFWMRQRVSPLLCGLGVLFLASVPIMVLHSTVGFPNLPMAFYVVAGGLYGIEALRRRNVRTMLLAGTLLGMASWTTIEGFQYAAVVVLLLILSTAWSLRPRLREYVWLSAPYLLFTGIWMLFYQRYGASGSQAMGALNSMLAAIKAGDYNLVELRLIFGYARRYLFELSTWGLLFSAGGVILLLGLPRLDRDLLPEARSLMLLFLGTGALTCALFYLRSFVTSDFLAWLIRGFPRGFLASAIFFAATVVLIAPPGDPWSPARSRSKSSASQASSGDRLAGEGAAFGAGPSPF